MDTSTIHLHGTPCGVCGCPAESIGFVGTVAVVRHVAAKTPCPLPGPAAPSSPRERVRAALDTQPASAADIARVALLPTAAVPPLLRALERDGQAVRVSRGPGETWTWRAPASGAVRGDAA